MRKLSKFTLVAGATVVVALVAAVAAALGAAALSVGATSLAVAMLAVLVFLADRRRRAQSARDRRKASRSIAQLEAQAQRVEDQVDMMQRRVIAALEGVRLDAADRARRDAAERRT